MSASTRQDAPIVTASDEEQPILGKISAALTESARVEARLVVPNGEEIPLPTSLACVLRTAARDLSRGDAVAVVSVRRELTTQEAADLLNVSRQYLVRLLDAGDIASTRTGTHRRIAVADLLAYKEQRDARRRTGLDDLARLSQELGLYDR